MTAIGYYSDNAQNIHQWDALTANGATPALKVNATNFTFVDKITGINVTVVHQGSLNGTDWFDLEIRSHSAGGIDYQTYAHTPLLYVRVSASNIGAGESFEGSVMCN